MPFFFSTLLTFLIAIFSVSADSDTMANPLRGTGNLGIVIERMAGSVLVVEHTTNTVLNRVTGLGDLSHASAVFSRDSRYAFLFGRDGGLSKVDLLTQSLTQRIVQGGNSIGGAISQDGRWIAVSNYEPGGVKIFDAETLSSVVDLPASSKTVGLVDAPEQHMVYSLFEGEEIFLVDLNPLPEEEPVLRRYRDVGRRPYDGLITPDGRYYVAGLFGEDGLALLDLWHPDRGVRKILSGYGRSDKKMPVYKMPHLEGWAVAGAEAFLPAVGRHEVLITDTKEWRERGRIAVHGQPVFVVARPDGRQVWVNFAFPDNDVVQIIDVPTRKIVKTLKPGKGVMHMEFTPRGERVWLSVRDENRVAVYDTMNFELVDSFSAKKPSGIFFSVRAHRIGL